MPFQIDKFDHEVPAKLRQITPPEYAALAKVDRSLRQFPPRNVFIRQTDVGYFVLCGQRHRAVYAWNTPEEPAAPAVPSLLEATPGLHGAFEFSGDAKHLLVGPSNLPRVDDADLAKLGS